MNDLKYVWDSSLGHRAQTKSVELRLRPVANQAMKQWKKRTPPRLYRGTHGVIVASSVSAFTLSTSTWQVVDWFRYLDSDTCPICPAPMLCQDQTHWRFVSITRSDPQMIFDVRLRWCNDAMTQGLTWPDACMSAWDMIWRGCNCLIHWWPTGRQSRCQLPSCQELLGIKLTT